MRSCYDNQPTIFKRKGEREMEERKMRYKVGDRVRVQSEEFVRNTGDSYDGMHYQFIGNSTDDLVWNHNMFKYCDKLATIMRAHPSLGHYYLDISKANHYWSEEMLLGAGEFSEDQKKFGGQFGLNTSKFSEVLL